MEVIAMAFLSVVAFGLAGAALKLGLNKGFNRFQPTRIAECPSCSAEGLDRGLPRREMPKFAILVLLSIWLVVTIMFSAFIVLLGIVGIILGRWDDFSFWMLSGFVLIASSIALRLVMKPLAEIRARPPLRCRACGYIFPKSP